MKEFNEKNPCQQIKPFRLSGQNSTETQTNITDSRRNNVNTLTMCDHIELVTITTPMKKSLDPDNFTAVFC